MRAIGAPRLPPLKLQRGWVRGPSTKTTNLTEAERFHRASMIFSSLSTLSSVSSRDETNPHVPKQQAPQRVPDWYGLFTLQCPTIFNQSVAGMCGYPLGLIPMAPMFRTLTGTFLREKGHPFLVGWLHEGKQKTNKLPTFKGKPKGPSNSKFVVPTKRKGTLATLSPIPTV